MSEQRQDLITISPQLTITVPGTPFRLFATDKWVRFLFIESAKGNKGEILIGTTEALASTINSHRLYNEGDGITLSGARFADLDAKINLRDIWIDGTRANDAIVATYAEIGGVLE